MVSTFASGWTYVETVAVDAKGAVYASVPAGAGAHRFLKFDPTGNLDWSMDNPVGFQDGPVSVAQFEHYNVPLFLPDGNVLMADGHRIRLIEMGAPTLPQGTTFELGTDWSDTANPNGVWAFRAGTAILPHVSEWALDNFSPPQGGWAFGSTVPFWFRASSPAPSADEDWQIGDIVVHTINQDWYQAGDGPVNVTWTSPGAGMIDITGGVWEARDIVSAISGGLRGNRWNLYVRGTLVSTGVIGGGDAYSRSNPFTFDLGSSRAAALESIAVSAGDVVRLEFVPTSAEGDYVGVKLSIDLHTSALPASPYAQVSTLAGRGAPGYQDGPGLSASFNQPNAGFVSGERAAYIADTQNHRVRRVDIPTGAVTTVAGTGAAGYLDGPAAAAMFNSPLGTFVDASGNVFVADTENNRVRKISAGNSPVVTTVAGTGVRGYADGPASSAQFDFPNDLVVDAAGNVYVSEFNNHTIRRITPDGLVSTFVGNGVRGFTDGLGTAAGLNEPAGLALDSTGNIFVTEWGSHRIRKVTPAGEVTTLAGNVFPGWLDARGSGAKFYEPDGIAVDASGTLFVTEHGNHTVRRIEPDGTVSTVAGTGSPGFVDGPAAVAQFNAPGGIGVDVTGSLVVADTGNQRVRLITLAVSVPIQFQRQLPTYFAPGVTLSVLLSPSPPDVQGASSAYAIEETPPEGWTVGNISAGGSYDPVTRKVKFGPFFDPGARVLRYDVTPPLGEAGPQSFRGVVSANGIEFAIGGATTILPPPYHPADLNPADYRMSVHETTAYGAAWRRGQNWSVRPSPIPIEYVTSAGLLWKNGESYRFDPNVGAAPAWWISNSGGRLFSLATGSPPVPGVTSLATRVLPSAFVAGEPFTVRILVQPSAQASVYAVENGVAPGLLVSEISDNGEYDSANQLIKWGPFFDRTERTLSFRANFPAPAPGHPEL